MKNVMAQAWEIARAAAVKFGGKAREYFAEALRMAWAIMKKGAVSMKPSKEVVFEMVRKTKAAAAEYHALRALVEKQGYTSYDQGFKIQKLMKVASDYNKELKSVLALFTEEERNAMRNEFAQ